MSAQSTTAQFTSLFTLSATRITLCFASCLLALSSPVFAVEDHLLDSNVRQILLGQPILDVASLKQSFDQSASAINNHLLHTGTANSQGDQIIGADTVRATFGLTGEGVKIGIISDSFNALGGATAGVASGNLPGPGNINNPTPVQVLMDDLSPFSSDEGRAMAEILHDIAPGAQILFHSAFNNAPAGQPGMAAAINNLVAAGANIIIDDVGFLNEPFFQDGPIAQAIDAAHATGVAYFASAGNSARDSYESQFNPIPSSLIILGGQPAPVHNFDINANEAPGDELLSFALAPGDAMRLVLQWDDPYASVGVPPGHTPTDFDAFLFDLENGNLVSLSLGDQQGGDDTFELVGAFNPTASTKFYGLSVLLFDGDPDRQLKINFYDDAILFDDDDTQSPTVIGHAAAQGALAVAAARYTDPATPEFFTSAGPTRILFDPAGNPINEIRNTPQITGIDGVDISFFGAPDFDSTGFPNFFGTSASVPHVAGVAALALQAAKQNSLVLSPDQLYNILLTTATDIGQPGIDDLTGHGLVNALAAIQTINAIAVPEPATAFLTALALAALSIAPACKRRR